jgi:pimeloyl-ACP methyl ester carboxylesterase
MTDTPLLALTRYDGPPEGARPTLIAHGLFGSARNWNVIAQRLSQTRPVVTVDMRNHGQSFWADSHSYPDLADDLARVIDNIGAGPLDVIGHSMGGKAAMTLALQSPDRVARLLVADIAPVPYSHSQSQFIDAMRAVDLSKVKRRSEVAEALGAQGVAPELQSFFTQSLDLAGRRWRYNLDVLERDMPLILGFPDIDARYDGPTLFLSGGASDYVKPDYRPRIKELFPQARFAKLPKAGHWLHAERPRDFIATAAAYLT